MNRLADETSPYLLQHAENPVDWYPWGEEALARARAEDKPILLSVGYAACHWCHVMAHESFEDAETAALMNERFVNIKVDREERPDVDGIYMDAVVAMTGHGGWPLTVFLTPEGEPFVGGTYFPPEPRHGMPAFRQVLVAISDLYRERRDEVAHRADVLLDALEKAAAAAPSSEPLTESLLFSRRRGGSASWPTRSGEGSAEPRSSRRPRRSSCCSGAAKRSWLRRRSTAWPWAECTTSSAAASTATRWTIAGSCRTSRRCSTTTRSSSPPTCTAGS